MPSFSRTIPVIGTLTAALVCGGNLLLACGDDTVTQTGDAGDASTDTTADVKPDIGNDVGMDVAQDVAQDGGSDVVDSGNDVVSDAPADYSAPLAFVTGVAAALCERIGACCFGAADAATFDNQGCINQVLPFGNNLSSYQYQLLVNGNVAFDPAKAQSCLTQISQINCTQNVITSAQATAIDTACFAALTGTVAVSNGCTGSIECVPGSFCDTPLGGDAGTCAALRGANQPCGDFIPQDPGYSETACSYRGSGNTGLYCHNADQITGNPLDAGTWTCMAAGGAGAPCNVNVECTTNLCDPGPNSTLFQCANQETFVYPGSCSAFIVDAGGGG
jgi:hypothetical protein